MSVLFTIEIKTPKLRLRSAKNTRVVQSKKAYSRKARKKVSDDRY